MKKFLLFVFTILVGQALWSQTNPTNRQVVLQAFWWDYWNANYPNGWANYLTELAPRLRSMGIDAIWIPPTIKNSGTNSVGYSPFDHYDLGEKYQKNSIKTRMGDKDELLRMMAVMKANGIDVIQDIAEYIPLEKGLKLSVFFVFTGIIIHFFLRLVLSILNALQKTALSNLILLLI